MNRPCCYFLSLLCVSSLILPGIAAYPDTSTRLKFYQLAQQSSAIARVRCIGVRNLVDNGEIWTDTAFKVLLNFKGHLPSYIVVREPGGKFEHVHSTVLEGVPEFLFDEQVILFLIGYPGRRFSIVSYRQGTFRIHRNLSSGMEEVTQDSANTPLFDTRSNAFTKAGIQDLRIDLFLEKMNREIHRQSLQ